MLTAQTILDFTVAICTYNGSQRLPQVLQQLQQQRGLEAIAWEILVIDNNSTDQTQAVVQQLQAQWPKAALLRYIFEPRQGLAFARQRAVQESQSPLIGFIDDDNLPATGWVAAAYQFGMEHPQAGAYGGQVLGQFDSPPPEEVQTIGSLLALQHYGEQQRQLCPATLQLPAGAGLVVRQQAWRQSVPLQPVLIGRHPGLMLAGEDYEAVLHLARSGWEIWYEPRMVIMHLIPAWRLEKDYLMALAFGAGLAMGHLWLMQAALWQWPLILLKTSLGNLRQLVVRLLRYQGQVATHPVAAADTVFFLGGAVSPFFCLVHWCRWRFSSPNQHP